MCSSPGNSSTSWEDYNGPMDGPIDQCARCKRYFYPEEMVGYLCGDCAYENDRSFQEEIDNGPQFSSA